MRLRAYSFGDEITTPHMSSLLMRFIAASAFLLMGLCGVANAAPDYQRFEVGNGRPSVECITPGLNGLNDSSPTADDTVVGSPSPPDILAGPNGICETIAAGDDVQVIPVGQGGANLPLIESGSHEVGDDRDNGICDNAPVFLPGSDDIQLIPVGQSIPNQVGVTPIGGPTTLSTTPSGDDVTSAIICPGANNNFESTLGGDDILGLNRLNCFACVSLSNSCITPSTNTTLDTTPTGDDFAMSVILTGADGICDSTATGTDTNLIPVGEGFQQLVGAFSDTTVCVDSGANGIAETTLCGNAGIDIRPNLLDEECDDGNVTNGDGCDDDVASGGNCTVTACGNGVISPGETCDDSNTDDNDACTASCNIAVCGDSSVCSDAATCTTGPGGGPEECDDGNLIETDGCTSSCEQLLCGDGTVDLGEICDDGNTNNNDACLNNCTPATCGDGLKCTNSVCITGPNGGPEECDPPDGSTCTAECGKIPTPCLDGIVNGLCTAPAGKAGNECIFNPDCDSSSGAGDGVCDVIETCDDGNGSDRDGCPTNCQTAVCGDGFVFDIGGPEACDDGNLLPGDGCDPLCQTECGNGLIDGSCSQGLPFGTLCATNADCDTVPAAGDGHCAGETCDLGCGGATTDGACTAGGAGSCQINADCDTAPASGDGICQGLTCGPGCTAGLTAVGATSPSCIAGTTGSGCATNVDCDTAPASGDGVCRGPACDTSAAVDLFCGVGPSTCSAVCQIATCGNAVRECSEECDAGTANGLSGTGCDFNCERTGIIGSSELTKSRECVAAWSLDDAPDELRRKRQKCPDCTTTTKTGTCTAGIVGAPCCKPSEAVDCDTSLGLGDGTCSACDADAATGVCTFKVAACLNRLGVPGCDSKDILSFELRGIKVTKPQQALATSRVTEAVRGLSPGKCAAGLVGTACTENVDCETSLGAANGLCSAVILGRCRKGAKNTTCTLGNDFECDKTFGGNNGKCDLGTGVRFLPSISQPADGGDQQSNCTASIDVEVATGTSLRLKSMVRRLEGKSDRDNLKLVCE